MAILLVTRDRALEERCRHAASAHYSITVIDALAQVPQRIAAAAPAVVLIDADTLQRPYPEQVAAIVATPGVGRVIVMTTDFVEDEEVALLRCGVQGCCRRGIDAESLRKVLTVTESGVWMTRSLLPRLIRELRRYAQPSATPVATLPPATAATEPPPRVPSAKLAALTRRERDIVKLLAEGASNKKVGEELDISERTVKGHLSNIFSKLGVSDRLKLVLWLNVDELPAKTIHK